MLENKNREARWSIYYEISEKEAFYVIIRKKKDAKIME